jgi:hypothetical protein
VCWSIMLQPGRSQIWFRTRSFAFSVDLNLPTALWSGSSQPLAEISTSNLPEVKVAGAICKLAVYKMWESQRLTALLASSAPLQGKLYFLAICLSLARTYEKQEVNGRLHGARWWSDSILGLYLRAFSSELGEDAVTIEVCGGFPLFLHTGFQ